MLLQNTCPSVGRYLATWCNYWFPIKSRFYCKRWRTRERERERVERDRNREREREKEALVKMQKLIISGVYIIIRISEKLQKKLARTVLNKMHMKLLNKICKTIQSLGNSADRVNNPVIGVELKQGGPFH